MQCNGYEIREVRCNDADSLHAVLDRAHLMFFSPRSLQQTNFNSRWERKKIQMSLMRLHVRCLRLSCFLFCDGGDGTYLYGSFHLVVDIMNVIREYRVITKVVSFESSVIAPKKPRDALSHTHSNGVRSLKLLLIPGKLSVMCVEMIG